MTSDSGVSFPDINGTTPSDDGFLGGFVGQNNPPGQNGSGSGWGGTGTSDLGPIIDGGLSGPIGGLFGPNGLFGLPSSGPPITAVATAPSPCVVKLWPAGPEINFCKVLIFMALAAILLLGILGTVLPDNKQDLQPIVDAIANNPEVAA